MTSTGRFAGATSTHLEAWLQDWTDLLDFEVTPVNDDEQIMKVIGG